jgi:hypothetical protein
MFMPIGKQLRELESFDGSGAPVLSVYLTTDPAKHGRGQLQWEVRRLVEALGADLPAPARADLAGELEVISDYLNSMVAPPHGLALFTCRRRTYFRVVRLPTTVQPCGFWQDRAETRPLREAADRAWGVLFEDGMVVSGP